MGWWIAPPEKKKGPTPEDRAPLVADSSADSESPARAPATCTLRGPTEFCNGFDAEYFKQFAGERWVPRRPKGSRSRKPMFVTLRANEAIDLHVGNMAALIVLGAGVRESLAKWVEAARNPTPVKKKRRRVISKGLA